MGRAIVREPQVFLMDEPLSNLDAKLRVSTRAQIASLQRRLGITTVYVTHDQVEAMTMGDRVAVLNFGKLQQVDTPLNLYDKPVNAFVAGFIGSPAMNMFTVPVTPQGAKLGNLTVPLPRGAEAGLGGDKEVVLGVRPEAFRPISTGESGLDTTVEVVEELGADAFVYASVEQEGGPSTVVVRHEARTVPPRGGTLTVCVDPEKVHMFSASSGERLSA